MGGRSMEGRADGRVGGMFHHSIYIRGSDRPRERLPVRGWPVASLPSPITHAPQAPKLTNTIPRCAAKTTPSNDNNSPVCTEPAWERRSGPAGGDQCPGRGNAVRARSRVVGISGEPLYLCPSPLHPLLPPPPLSLPEHPEPPLPLPPSPEYHLGLQGLPARALELRPDTRCRQANHATPRHATHQENVRAGHIILHPLHPILSPLRSSQVCVAAPDRPVLINLSCRFPVAETESGATEKSIYGQVGRGDGWGGEVS
ncbi:hypothetical protein E2C01_076577 [Portunus trituberculatus]|uniref:Uncharacterized protein n=1 Tax=Portunus trituberculatus TaxID=210409 RepID=A0A5B7IIZ8_PORTR|nr:hypothetical protein [Portunus trituberculatus]